MGTLQWAEMLGLHTPPQDSVALEKGVTQVKQLPTTEATLEEWVREAIC